MIHFHAWSKKICEELNISDFVRLSKHSTIMRKFLTWADLTKGDEIFQGAALKALPFKKTFFANYKPLKLVQREMM